MVPAEFALDRLEKLERILCASRATRVGSHELWRALAQVFPHRSAGPSERRLLVEALRQLETRGIIKLPPSHGKRWDRAMDPAIPTSVDLIRQSDAPSAFPWKTFPWHPSLEWVAGCRSLSAQQVAFLRNVHQGLVHGMFREAAPFKYRSLQLTGDEKLLASLMSTSLFGEGRLTLELLACLPDALPLAWEPVGGGGRLIIFENAGPFAVARRVLEGLPSRPYDLVAYGGGRSVLAGVGHLKTIERVVETIHYVGDFDEAGLEIALQLRTCAAKLGLPPVKPATELHRQMLLAASALDHPDGWVNDVRSSNVSAAVAVHAVSDDLRSSVERVLAAGRRIPEEVLGPDELRRAWSQ